MSAIMSLKLLAAVKSVWLILEQSTTTGIAGEPYTQIEKEYYVQGADDKLGQTLRTQLKQ